MSVNFVTTSAKNDRNFFNFFLNKLLTGAKSMVIMCYNIRIVLIDSHVRSGVFIVYFCCMFGAFFM